MTPEETVARVLAEHINDQHGRSIDGEWWWICRCGEPLGENECGSHRLFEAHRAHVAAAVVAALDLPEATERVEWAVRPEGYTWYPTVDETDA